ncbi:hypothetical protein Tco_0765192 [Tanacetum coccineum]
MILSKFSTCIFVALYCVAIRLYALAVFLSHLYLIRVHSVFIVSLCSVVIYSVQNSFESVDLHMLSSEMIINSSIWDDFQYSVVTELSPGGHKHEEVDGTTSPDYVPGRWHLLQLFPYILYRRPEEFDYGITDEWDGLGDAIEEIAAGPQSLVQLYYGTKAAIGLQTQLA